MHRFRRLAVLATVVSAVTLIGASFAAADDYKYVGVKKCKTCHKKAASGNQYGKWLEGPHANAYASLASEEAIAKAKEMGIEAAPQEAPECLECHVTAFSVMADLATQKITLEEGVSCESCHGAGSGYYKKKTMKGITAGEIDGATVGLVVPTEETCVKCHKEEGNPFFKEFNFEERLAEIAHPIPGE